LRQIDRQTPKDREFHLIADHAASPQASGSNGMPFEASALHMHFTPTSAPWLNMVEPYFGGFSEAQLKRGIFRGISDLENAIEQDIERHHHNPKPFTRKANVADILPKVRSGHASY
jgi:hypothetical protein